MFHQVFICDIPEEENSSATQSNDVNMSSGLDDSKEEISNVEAKCGEMELDHVPETGLEQPLKPEVEWEQISEEEKVDPDKLCYDEAIVNDQTKCVKLELDPLSEAKDLELPVEQLLEVKDQELPHKLELPLEQLPEANKAHSDKLCSLILHQDNEVVSNEIKLDDIADPIKTPNLEVKLESLAEENKEHSDILCSSEMNQRDEVLNRKFCTAISEEISNSLTFLSSGQQETINSVITSDNIDKYRYSVVDKSIDIQENENIKVLVVNNILINNQYLQGNEHVKIENQTSQINQITNSITSAAGLQNENLLNTLLDDPSNNINKGSNSCHLAPENTEERVSFSVEEDSGSDWEQEYFGSTKADLKRRYSKDPCQQNVNLKSNITCLNSINHSKTSHNYTILKNIHPIKMLRVVVHRLKDPIELQKNKSITSLKEGEIDEGEVLIKDRIKCDKSNGNSNKSNVIVSRDEKYCSVCNLIATKANHNHCYLKTAKCKERNNLIPLNQYDNCKTPFNVSKKISNSKKMNIITQNKCIGCNKYFSNKKGLKRHIKEKHPETMLILEQEERAKKENEISNGTQYEEEVFLCKNCYKPFKTKEHLSSHKKTLCYGYRRSRSHQCDVCGKLFPGNNKLQDHKNTHTNAKPYKCVACDKGFNYSRARQWHFKKVHQQKNVQKLLCSFCGITHISLFHMLAHEEAHRLPHGTEIPTPFRCGKCGKGFISKFLLTRHQKQHEKVKCPQCSEMLENKSRLRVHLRNAHNIRKQYKCNTCGKILETSDSLQTHAHVHSSLRPFSCEICGKDFKQKRHIKQHLITHSEARPLTCPDCGDCFKRKTHLKQHISAIHGKGKKR